MNLKDYIQVFVSNFIIEDKTILSSLQSLVNELILFLDECNFFIELNFKEKEFRINIEELKINLEEFLFRYFYTKGLLTFADNKPYIKNYRILNTKQRDKLIKDELLELNKDLFEILYQST